MSELDCSPKRFSSLAEAFFDVAKKNPEAIAYSRPAQDQFNLASEDFDPCGNSRTWAEIPYKIMREHVESIGAYLESLGVKAGTRVAILSNTRPEWGEAEFGIFSAAGSVVTCYTSDPAERNGFVLKDSGAEIVFVENQEQLKKLLQLMETPFVIPATEHNPEYKTTLSLKKIICFEDVLVSVRFRDKVTTLRDVLETPGLSAPTNYKDRAASEEATVIYTSGTTGAPKGVVATHGQHLANVSQLMNSGIVDNIRKVFQLLPLAHGFGLQVYHTLVSKGGQAVFARVPDRRSSALTAAAKRAVFEDIAQSSPQLVPTVPLVLDNIRAGIIAKTKLELNFIKPLLMKLTLWSYAKAWEAQQSASSPGLLARISKALLESPISARIGIKIKEQIKQKILGNDFAYFISGGAPLKDETANFFWSLGMPVYEGYGSTEGNVPLTCNTPRKWKIGTVGPVLDASIEVKITEHGELLFRGPNVASGYLNRPEATRKVWDEQGWLHTGDRGEIVDGCVKIIGRMDDMIVTANGKNIIPDPIENRLKAHPCVQEAVLVGHGREALIALISLKEEEVRKWALTKELKLDGPIHLNLKVQQLLKQEILALEQGQSHKNAETVRNLGFIAPLSVGNGLTPTMKVQRKKIIAANSSLIDLLYTELHTFKKAA